MSERSAVIEHVSESSFETTLERLIEAIAEAGLILFDRIDHDAGARDVGLTMPRTTVLSYGHPKGGTPIMLAAPLAALDLPLRVLVRERDDGRTSIAFRPIVALLGEAGVGEDLARRLEPAQEILLSAVMSVAAQNERGRSSTCSAR